MSSTTSVTVPPLPFDLVSMYEQLSVAPRLDIVRTVTETFLAQMQRQSQAFPAPQESSNVNESNVDNTDTRPASLAARTLLKFLFAHIDTEYWSPQRLGRQRDEILAGEAAVTLGQALHSALSLDQDVYPPAPAFFSQLAWCALLIELEPPQQRRRSHLAGMDLCSPGLANKKLRRELVRHLKSKVRTVDGFRSTDEARLAASLLEALYPELARDDLASTMYCGSLAWANLTHAIALSEALRPGSSKKMDRAQLENQLLTACQTTNGEELGIVTATGLRPALQWAVLQGKLAHREDGNYSNDDLAYAQSVLDTRREKAARSVEMLFSPIPDRFAMARQKLREAHADSIFQLSNWAEHPLEPVGSGAWWTYLPHAHVNSQSSRPDGFTMLELFAAGYTINGSDEFRPREVKDEKTGITLTAPDLDRLRGIDIPGLFNEAFGKYWENAKTGYQCLIETLFEQISFAEREFIKQSYCYVYALREQQTFPAAQETVHEKESLRGRMGFVIQCVDVSLPRRYPDVSYEVFPLQARMTNRTDLPRFSSVDLTGQNSDLRVHMAVDWQAYRSGRDPLPGQTANLVPVLLHAFRPDENLSKNLRQTAMQVANKHMFFYRDSLYAQQRGKTLVEEVDNALPQAMAVWSVFVPGLGCYTALKTNQHLAMQIATCSLDIASVLLLPAVRLGAGVVGLARVGGQISVSVRLGRLAGMARTFLTDSIISYVKALNPINVVMPVYWTGRVLYGSGSRAVLALSRLRARIAAAPRGTRAFRMSSYKLPNENQIKSAAELDDFLTKNNAFGSTESLRRQRRQGTLDLLEEGAEVRIHTRPDGTKTLVTPDEITARQVTYIDLANDTTVTMGGVYNYRQLRTWTTIAGGSEAGVINVPIANVTATRSALEADRVTSVKTAMEQGIPLPALDVTGASGSYTIVNGNHRLQAAQQLGLETVPIKVATATTVAVPSSQIGYTANYGLHVRGILVVPAVLSQTSEKQQARP